MAMTRGMAFTAANEGKRLLPYKDSLGVLTIGYGHNLNFPISDAAAEQIFSDDYNEKTREAWASAWWPKVVDDAPRSIALIDFIYQLSEKKFENEFPHAFAAAVAGDWLTCADQLQWTDAAKTVPSRWFAECPNRAAKVLTILRTGQMEG